HGGATYNSQANREQLRDCTSLLSSLVPLVIEVMMDGADQIWGGGYIPFSTDLILKITNGLGFLY
ncbi:hypothetical protein D5E81_04425, partial [Vibrio parahaemolyticus]